MIQVHMILLRNEEDVRDFLANEGFDGVLGLYPDVVTGRYYAVLRRNEGEFRVEGLPERPGAGDYFRGGEFVRHGVSFSFEELKRLNEPRRWSEGI